MVISFKLGWQNNICPFLTFKKNSNVHLKSEPKQKLIEKVNCEWHQIKWNDLKKHACQYHNSFNYNELY